MSGDVCQAQGCNVPVVEINQKFTMILLKKQTMWVHVDTYDPKDPTAKGAVGTVVIG